MGNSINHQVRLAGRPVGLPKTSDWTLGQEPVRDLDKNEVLVRIHYISIDPTMRGWMNDRDSYLPKLALGDVMRALTVGEVVASRHAQFTVGDFVAGIGGVQEYAISDGSDLMRVDIALAPLHTYLNTLGIAGLTAYCGLTKLGRPKSGETVLVSGAAGSVGAHVGQIAKIHGCRVVGVAGGKRKCDYIVGELGFDAAVDYKSENLLEGLAGACPDGVDVFFDNVGAQVLDAALANINLRGRVVLCGGIAHYNATAPIQGPANYSVLIPKRARMEGFIYLDYAAEWPSMIKELAQWLADGRIKCADDIVEGGVEVFPETLPRLFTGENFGKLMIKVV